MRSLRRRSQELFACASLCEYSVIAVTETWLSADFASSEFLPPDYAVFRKDRRFDVVGGDRGGGVMLAVRDAYRTEALDLSYIDDVSASIDIVGCKIMMNSNCLFLYVVYIPPSVTIVELESFLECFSQHTLASKNIVVLGDFNISSFSNASLCTDARSRLMTNFLAYTSLCQCNTICNSLGRFLDLVLSSYCFPVHHADVPMITEDRHHPALCFNLQIKSDASVNFAANTAPKAFNFKRADFVGLYAALSAIDWAFLDSYSDINIACDAFYDRLYNILPSYVPYYKSSKRKYPQWYTPELVNTIGLKQMYHRRYRRCGREVDRLEFVRLRRLSKSLSCEAYKRYLRGLECEMRGNPGRFWAYINAKRGTTRIGGLMKGDDDVLYDTPKCIVNAFASYFSSVYTTSSDSINLICEPPLQMLDLPTIDERVIVASVKKLKNRMTSGPDRIPSFLVKDCCAAFVPALLRLFNLAMSTSTFPAVWKQARVCPVLKAGDTSMISNYRPISVLCNFAKVFEMSVYAHVFPRVRDHIAIEQHGFFPNRSVVTNLTTIAQYLSDVVDSRGQVDVVYTDFSKAFDRMDHKVLLAKLRLFNFSDAFIKFIDSYLSHRVYYVNYNGFSSDQYVGTSGVPQGSNLGPLLFLLFINDLPKIFSCERLLYADDLKLFMRIDSLDDCMFLQHQLDLLQNWCSLNHLHLNVNKCKVLTVTRRKEPLNFAYCLDSSELERVQRFKDLGVYFDCSLAFDFHVNETVKSAYKMLGFLIRNSCSFTNVNTLKLLYFAYVRSKLEYCSVVWDPYYLVYKQALERVQRKFLKYLHFRRHNSYPSRGYSNDLLLGEFGVDSLERRRILASLVFFVRLVNRQIDCPGLLSQVSFRTSRPGSRHVVAFWCPQARTNVMLKSPIFTMTSHFNRVCNEFDIFGGSPSELHDLVNRYF